MGKKQATRSKHLPDEKECVDRKRSIANHLE